MTPESCLEYAHLVSRSMSVGLDAADIAVITTLESKPAINKYIIGKHQTEPSNPKKEKEEEPEFLKAMRDKISTATQGIRLSEAGVLQKIASIRSAITEQRQIVAEEEAKLAEKLVILNTIRENPNKLVPKWYASILRSLSHPHFHLYDVKAYSDRVHINYVSNKINCGHTVRASNYDHYVNLGHFNIEITIYRSHWKAKVLPLKDNIRVRSYVHPHVDSDGEICWGTASEPVNQAYNRQDIEGILSVIHATLTQYNVENPYVNLWRFDAAPSTTLQELVDRQTDVDRSSTYEDHFDENPEHEVGESTDNISCADDAVTNTPLLRKIYALLDTNGLPCPEFIPIDKGLQPEDYAYLYGKAVRYYKMEGSDTRHLALPYDYRGTFSRVRSDTRVIAYKFPQTFTNPWTNRGLCTYESLSTTATESDMSELRDHINRGIDTDDLVVGTIVIPTVSYSEVYDRECNDSRKWGVITKIVTSATGEVTYEVFWQDNNSTRERIENRHITGVHCG